MISVIVPVYNVESYLEECIKSILMQSYTNLEIILVDDESIDNSGNICDLYSNRDNRIKVIHKKNGGLSSARNAGLKIATGKYISFIDSDDFLLDENAYSEMVDIIEKENSDLVFGDALRYYSANKKTSLNNLKEREVFKNTLDSEELLLICLDNDIIFTPVWLNLYKKELLDKNKIYFREGIYHEDEDFTPRVLLQASRISIYKKEFYGYRQRENSIMTSGDNPKKGKDLIETAENLVPYLEKIKNKELKQKFGEYISSLIIFQAFKYKFSDISKNQIAIINKYCYSKEMKIRAKLMNINLNLFYYIERKFRDIEAKYGKMRGIKK